MTLPDPDKISLAAGFVTETLDEAEVALALELLASDDDFISLINQLREDLAVRSNTPVAESVWQGIERRLTDKKN